MLRNATLTDADKPQNTSTFTRDILYFQSQGVKCQAWLYMPKQHEGAKPPVVVAAHGLGALDVCTT
jgi:poly(3-hydroxybutyrate) depolymerase